MVPRKILIERRMPLLVAMLGSMALCVMAAGVSTLSGQTRDAVVLRSGQRVTGEVEGMRRGSLSYDTPEMDVVEIDWDDIAFLTSPAFFEVLTSGGQRYFGSLASADTAVLIVVGDQRSDTLTFEEIVGIGPIEGGFFARTNGFVDFGTNLTQANSLASILLKGRFAYRGPKWGFGVDADTYYQTQETTDSLGETTEQSTSRASTQLTLNRFLGARWTASAGGRFETNEELNLDSRFLGILGGSYMIVRNQGLEFSAGGGGAINDELFTGEERSTSGEVVVSAAFDVFDVGDIDVFTNLDTYTNPSDGGRFRFNFDGRVSWEIFSDFYLGFTATNRYDSSPPSPGAVQHDYQYGVTIGWSWS